MKRSILLAAPLALALLISGCSAVKISSTSESRSKPADVGISDGSDSPAPNQTPTMPAGMNLTTVNLGSECPVEVSLALDEGWDDEASYDGYQLFASDTGAIITINCNADDESSPQALVEKAQERMFAEAGSAKISERVGQVEGGQYWVFHGSLASEDMRAVDHHESVIYGMVSGISRDGRLHKVSVDMLAQKSDTETQDEFAQILPTVRLGDEELATPDLR